MGVEDPFAAYCLDEACLYFGSEVSEFVNKAGERKKSDKAKRGAEDNALRKMLGQKQKFRDPMDLARRKKG